MSRDSKYFEYVNLKKQLDGLSPKVSLYKDIQRKIEILGKELGNLGREHIADNKLLKESKVSPIAFDSANYTIKKSKYNYSYNRKINRKRMENETKK